MRKVILYISMSVDGFIADKNGGVDWIAGSDENYESDYGYVHFIKNIDTVIFGYNTYRQIVEDLSPHEWVYKGLQSYVFTNKKKKDTQDVRFVNEDVSLFIEELKNKDGKNIWICGGAQLVNQLIKQDMIDEYHITTIPILLGNGIRLFQENNPNINLKLEKSQEENGIITNIYSRK